MIKRKSFTHSSKTERDKSSHLKKKLKRKKIIGYVENKLRNYEREPHQ